METLNKLLENENITKGIVTDTVYKYWLKTKNMFKSDKFISISINKNIIWIFKYIT